jgi:hydroxyacylglutathione hydrolase
MPLTVITVPCLSDNYAFILRDDASGRVGVVDVPEAAPIQVALDTRGWTLTDVLLTHHHWDHVAGLADLDHGGARIWGAAADAHRLPPLTDPLAPGDTLALGDSTAQIWDVSGHTVGHIAFIFDGYAFTGDSLMAMGCGRLFEGTPAQMWASLSQFATLPDTTQICSGHEYTASNAKFARTIEPDSVALISRCEQIDRARTAHLPTVPSTLASERATNPFLRAHLPHIKAATGTTGAPDDQTFAAIRAAKDAF